MGIFRNKSTKSHNSNGSYDEKITNEDIQHFKVRSASVHDPILQAVNEAQPFEDITTHNQNRQSYNQMAEQNGSFDVFGRQINNPDISNPLRSRDERPLDTIRGFEYAITGDPSYRDRLETDHLGFRVRQDFPRFGANAYAPQNGQAQSQYNSANVHSFSNNDNNMYQEQGVYQAPVTEKKEEKKKRGLFGRKKK